jgi:hypothetical protein
MDEVLARYAALDAGTPSAPRRYLLVSAGQEGWGNRMLVLASALLACLHTQRRLVLDWPVEPAWRAGIALPPFSWPARSRPCTRTAVCGRSVPFLARRPNCRCRRKKAQGGAARPADVGRGIKCRRRAPRHGDATRVAPARPHRPLARIVGLCARPARVIWAVPPCRRARASGPVTTAPSPSRASSPPFVTTAGDIHHRADQTAAALRR